MRNRILTIMAAGAMLALAACAGQGGVTVGGPGSALSDVATFTAKDLDAAESIAQASHDEVAIPCYPALKQWLATVPGASGPITITGAVSGFEAGRLAVNGVSVGVPKEIEIACGPLYMETHGQLLSLLTGKIL